MDLLSSDFSRCVCRRDRRVRLSQQQQQRSIKRQKREPEHFPLPGAVKDEPGEEDDEEVVGVPEDLEVAASDDLHGGGDDEDEGQSDDDPGEAGDGGEDEVGGDLLRILRQKRKRRKREVMMVDTRAVAETRVINNTCRTNDSPVSLCLCC